MILGRVCGARSGILPPVGSVAWSMVLSPQAVHLHTFEIAEIAAKAVLDEALTVYPASAWDTARSSGTVRCNAHGVRVSTRYGDPRRAGPSRQTALKAQTVRPPEAGRHEDDRRAVVVAASAC
jgi:exopolyphosphatase/guanosine-5'-triphosphate,3'-diphosphate pyrophosphatase